MQAIFVTARGTTLQAPVGAWTPTWPPRSTGSITPICSPSSARSPPGDGSSSWLKAGVLDQGRFAPTERGSPQGGVISPVLMNVALHGMEHAAGVRYITTGSNAGTARPGSPVLIRYADDAARPVSLAGAGRAGQGTAGRSGWRPGGLAFNEDKTRIVHLDDGVDFLGFNVRRYRGKLLIKPSKAAVKRIRARLTAEMRALRGHNAQMVLIRLNPIIRGWSAYYRHGVSARVFNELDWHMWKLTYKWANWTHPHKGKRWIVGRYFGAFNPDRRDRWVFGDRDSGAYLLKFAWTKITRHTLVKGWASPDDPALTSYWAARRRRGKPPLDRRPAAAPATATRDAARSAATCCSTPTTSHGHPDEWEQWITAVRKATRHRALALDTGPRATDGPASSSVSSTAHCRNHPPGDDGSGPALLQPHPTAHGLARAGCLESGHGRF